MRKRRKLPSPSGVRGGIPVFPTPVHISSPGQAESEFWCILSLKNASDAKQFGIF